MNESYIANFDVGTELHDWLLKRSHKESLASGQRVSQASIVRRALIAERRRVNAEEKAAREARKAARINIQPPPPPMALVQPILKAVS